MDARPVLAWFSMLAALAGAGGAGSAAADDASAAGTALDPFGPRLAVAWSLDAASGLSLRARGGPLPLGSLAADRPAAHGDALEAVRATMRAVGDHRAAIGHPTLREMTLEIAAAPSSRWRPVEWVLRAAREAGAGPEVRFVAEHKVRRSTTVEVEAVPADASDVLRLVVSAGSEPKTSPLLTVGKYSVRTGDERHVRQLIAQFLRPSSGAAPRFVELGVAPEAAGEVPCDAVLDVVRTLAALGRTRFALAFDPSALPAPTGLAAIELPPAATIVQEVPPFQAFPHRGTYPGNEGASPHAADAVHHALRWLAAHQSPSGAWEAAGHRDWCNGARVDASLFPNGAGDPQFDVGVTGLALSAFLGAGYSHRGDHEFATAVAKGLRNLIDAQDADGCFGPRTKGGRYVYNHAFAALAVVEALGMTGSRSLQGPAQKALDFIALARNPYFAWRYGVRPGDNDTSVTGAMAMVLQSARIVNRAVPEGEPPLLRIDEEAFDGTRAWIDKMTDPDYGRVGYVMRGGGPDRPPELADRFPVDRSESLTAVGCLARLFLGENPAKSEMIRKGAELLGRLPPTWNTEDGSIDMIHWYYGALAMFQVGGEPWKRWSRAMDVAVRTNQHLDSDYCLYKGSWDPVDVWSPLGGRVYSTATMALCLEVYGRYRRISAER